MTSDPRRPTLTLRFLGTGASGGTPGRGRSLRLESSLLVQDDASILIDITRHFAEQARSLPGIDAILLTHGHRDASGGMARLRHWCEHEHLEQVPVYASRETIGVLRHRLARLDHCRLVEVEPGEVVRCGDLSMEALEVPHAREPQYRTFAWRIMRAGRTVVYASDLAELTADLERFCRGASLLVVDAAMWRRRIFSHLTIDEALPELCRWRVERILLTQIGRSVPAHERLDRAAAAICPRARPAYDGLEVALAGPLRSDDQDRARRVVGDALAHAGQGPHAGQAAASEHDQ